MNICQTCYNFSASLGDDLEGFIVVNDEDCELCNEV